MNSQNKRKVSGIFLVLGMAFLAFGIIVDNTLFTWIAIGCVLISLLLGGRWLRPRKK